MLHHASVGRVQGKDAILCWHLTFLVLVFVFHKDLSFIIFISFFDKILSFKKRILSNQKPGLVIKHCQWNCMTTSFLWVWYCIFLNNCIYITRLDLYWYSAIEAEPFVKLIESNNFFRLIFSLVFFCPKLEQIARFTYNKSKIFKLHLWGGLFEAIMET